MSGEIRESPDGTRLAVPDEDHPGGWLEVIGWAAVPEGEVEGWTRLVPAVPVGTVMAELDRRVLEAWADAEELESGPGMDRDNEQVVRVRMYAMGLSVAAATVGRPEEVWASPERREAVRAWAKDRATARDRLAGLVGFLQGRRADCLRALRACTGDSGQADYWRWQGHAELARQVLEMLDEEVPQ